MKLYQIYSKINKHVKGRQKTTLFYRGSDQGGGVGGINYSEFANGDDLNYKFYNLRGDVIMGLDSNRNKSSSTYYFEFGQNEQLSGDITTDRHRANTKVEDETNLLNDGKRFRHLELDIFLTPDPLEYVDGFNPYIYVNQNPWGKWDPLGLAEAKYKDQEFINSCSAATLVNFQIAYKPPSGEKIKNEATIRSELSKIKYPSGKKQIDFKKEGVSFHIIKIWLKNNYKELDFVEKQMEMKDIAIKVNENKIPAVIASTDSSSMHAELVVSSDKDGKNIEIVSTPFNPSGDDIAPTEMSVFEYNKKEKEARDRFKNNYGMDSTSSIGGKSDKDLSDNKKIKIKAITATEKKSQKSEDKK